MDNKLAIANNQLLVAELNESVKIYWDALALITPKLFTTDSYSICFYHPSSQQPRVKIIRFCVEYQEYFGIQDELFFPCVNTGGKINFEVTKDLQFRKSPEKLVPHVMQFIDECKALVSEKGASISVMGYGILFVSDGEKWVKPILSEKITDKLVSSGQLISKKRSAGLRG